MTRTRHLCGTLFASALLAFGLLSASPQALAQSPILEFLKKNPEWEGKAEYFEGSSKPVLKSIPIAVTFHITGSSPSIQRISYRPRDEADRDVLEFKIEAGRIKFLIPPLERNRWFDLELTSDGLLKGEATGKSRDGKGTFSNAVLLKPKQ